VWEKNRFHNCEFDDKVKAEAACRQNDMCFSLPVQFGNPAGFCHDGIR
jgi:hypothetical protein